MIIDILKYLCADEEADTGVEIEDSMEGSESQEEIDIPSTFKVGDKEYTAEDIQKFENGYNSYSEQVNKYKELEDKSRDAMDLFNYIQNNPDLAKALYEADEKLTSGNSNNIKDRMPSEEREVIMDLRREITNMKIDKELNTLKSKDPNLDEIKVLNIATENNLPLDIAYKVWKADNFEAHTQKALQEQSKQITKNIQNNRKVTKTLITEGDESNTNGGDFGLNNLEKTMADKLGMSYEDYAKWRV